MTALMGTRFPDLRLLGRGKVRDNYEVGDALLIVSTDRISAFDHVLPNGIPDKGRVLNQISLYWFEKTAGLVRNHLKEHRVDRFPETLRRHAEVLRGRSVLVTRLKMLPVECVVRGYLAGSGYKEYVQTGSVCGLELPPGLQESSRLPEPLFTPSTKATSGHDENIPFARVIGLVGRETAGKLRDLSLSVYRKACEHAESRGILIADTKFEFGIDGDEVVLADEVLTPDSSRFWPKGSWSRSPEQDHRRDRAPSRQTRGSVPVRRRRGQSDRSRSGVPRQAKPGPPGSAPPPPPRTAPAGARRASASSFPGSSARSDRCGPGRCRRPVRPPGPCLWLRRSCLPSRRTSGRRCPPPEPGGPGSRRPLPGPPPPSPGRPSGSARGSRFSCAGGHRRSLGPVWQERCGGPGRTGNRHDRP